jgi:3-carboxymethyl-3-hydroxy-acyl-[acp] dehydratase
MNAGANVQHQQTRYQTIEVSASSDMLRITMDRVPQQNAINGTLLAELHAVLDEAEQLPGCRLVVIQGAPGVFCTGMDFSDATDSTGSLAERGGAEFLGLLKRLTATPRAVVSVVDGRATGGGVGIAAASDFVVATPRSVFSLPEALWGLLPCCVLPFLIRRVGFQPAYAMSLSTLPVTAEQAHRTHLADELTDQPEHFVRRLRQRVSKLDQSTIAALKRYQRQLWFLSEDMERAAVAEFSRLMSSPAVRERISGFVTSQVFPWESQR